MLENFRDISLFNYSIRKGIVYRSAQNGILENFDYLNNLNIDTIIDLRTIDEVEKYDYRISLSNNFSYFNIPLELEFSKTVYSGTPMESAYKYLALDCKEELLTIFNKILLAKGSLLIHCRQGMDRTGIVIALIHLICSTSYENIIEDYLQSGELALKVHIDIFLNNIKSYENVDNYLNSVKFSSGNLTQIKNKLLV